MKSSLYWKWAVPCLFNPEYLMMGKCSDVPKKMQDLIRDFCHNFSLHLERGEGGSDYVVDRQEQLII